MKTTLNLPDELMKAVKMRAVQESRTLQDTIASLLRAGLGQEQGEPRVVRRRVRLPLIQCAHAADREREMTPDRVADALLDDEVQGWRESLR